MINIPISGASTGLFTVVTIPSTAISTPISTFTSSLCAVIGVSPSSGSLLVYRPSSSLNPFTAFEPNKGYIIVAHTPFTLSLSSSVSATPSPTPSPSAIPSPTPSPSAAVPIVEFINTDGAEFNASSTSSYYFKIDDAVNTFTITVDGLSAVQFTNVFDPTNFSNCKLTLSPAGPNIVPLASEVFVTNSVDLSTSTGNLFTFYYYTTGSVIAGLAPSAGPALVPPTSRTFVPAGTYEVFQLNSFGNYRPLIDDYYIYSELVVPTATSKQPLYSRNGIASFITDYAMLDEVGSGHWPHIIESYWHSQYDTLLFAVWQDAPYTLRWIYKTKVGHPTPFKLISRPFDIRLLPGYNPSTTDATSISGIQEILSSVDVTPFSDVVRSWTFIDSSQPTWKSVPWNATPFEQDNTYSFSTPVDNGLGGVMQSQSFTLTL